MRAEALVVGRRRAAFLADALAGGNRRVLHQEVERLGRRLERQGNEAAAERAAPARRAARRRHALGGALPDGHRDADARARRCARAWRGASCWNASARRGRVGPIRFWPAGTRPQSSQAPSTIEPPHEAHFTAMAVMTTSLLRRQSRGFRSGAGAPPPREGRRGAEQKRARLVEAKRPPRASTDSGRRALPPWR